MRWRCRHLFPGQEGGGPVEVTQATCGSLGGIHLIHSLDVFLHKTYFAFLISIQIYFYVYFLICDYLVPYLLYQNPSFIFVASLLSAFWVYVFLSAFIVSYKFWMFCFCYSFSVFVSVWMSPFCFFQHFHFLMLNKQLGLKAQSVILVTR